MTAFLVGKFGEPCRECGWSFSATGAEVEAVLRGAVERYAALTDGCRGQESIPELGWNVSSYVFHVAENTRIWGERLVASALRPGVPITTWDEDALDVARGSAGSSIEAARWSLAQAIESWWAVQDVAGDDVVVDHPDQGPMSVLDVGRAAAHELHHHALDVERIVGG